ncbi:unnamed protein product [Staurois parvus]|uniref:Uncharacterized protein n=1 Tax=Staurois parvus TaxID=386267 RepID=A0ABN9HIW4_9NEOB|nr:unnamed protein product [Staurois parvus]
MWARTQGPHDPLLPGGPISCQSAPGSGCTCHHSQGRTDHLETLALPEGWGQ